MVKKRKKKKSYRDSKKNKISVAVKKRLNNKVNNKKVESKGFFKKLFNSTSKKVEIKTKPSKINLKSNDKKLKVVKNVIEKSVKEKPDNKKIKVIKKSVKEKPDNQKPKIFIKTGIKGLDALFENSMGIPDGASVLIEGGPGSGKTIFCLATVNELCKKGKKCLYMSFEESDEQLMDHMDKFNWNAKEFVKKGLLRISRFDAIDISRSIEALLSAAKKELLIDVEPMFFPDDFVPDFVVIDSLTSIASAFTGEESRFRIYMEQLFRYLEKNKMTNFLIREVSSPSHVGTTFTQQGEAVSFLSDGIIVIYNVVYDSGKRTSAIEILKMRGSSFKRIIVEFEIINKKGIKVNPNKVLKKSKKSNFILT